MLALLHDGYTRLVQEATRKLGTDSIRIAGVGVGFPGQVKGGVAVGAANLSPAWRDVPLAEELSARLEGGPPVVLMNDADAALLAEVWAGAARGRRDVVMISECCWGRLVSDPRLMDSTRRHHDHFMRRHPPTHPQRWAQASGRRRWWTGGCWGGAGG